MKINKKSFDQEIAMCKKLYRKSKDCNWRKCKDCGAVPLLYKLQKGKVVENESDIKSLKKKFLGI